MAGFYVEIIRNMPLLLQLLFWYNAVLKALPAMRESLAIPGGGFLNNRGLFLPQPVFQPGSRLCAHRARASASSPRSRYRIWARRRQMRTGQQAPVLWVTLGLVIALPLAVLALSGFPLAFDYPEAGRFNIRGGIEMLPEFMALLFGLVIYTAAFIAEVVRAGILAVAKGQTEAAYSLGLRPGPTLRLVVIPQAMRVIIPPLTSQYLNLTKNSSLAVAIGYPDLVQIFAGTVLNQTGQAVEVDRHHHGGLSHHQPRHVGADESLQPPHGAGGALSDIATMTDAKLMEGPAFVRTKPFAPLPPPLTEAGAIGWLRENLFSSALNIVLTIVCALLIVWIVPPLVKFLLIDAVWDGSSRADCLPRPDRPEVGACWAFVIDRINFFTYGFYPIERALAGRRVLRAAGGRHRLAGVARRAAPRSRRDLFLRHPADCFADPAARLAVDRLVQGRRPRHGAACW